jgi:hypothetical protein
VNLSRLEVSDRGEDYTIRVAIDGFGCVHVLVEKRGGGSAPLPRLTPFEAGMLAKTLERAAEQADTK